MVDHALVRLRADAKQARTVSVKIRYTDMDEHQGQSSLAEPTDVEQDMYPLLSKLLKRLWDRRVRLRMVQVTLTNVYHGYRQVDLFGVKQRQRDLALTCEAIRDRHGRKALMRAHDWVVSSGQSSQSDLQPAVSDQNQQ